MEQPATALSGTGGANAAPTRPGSGMGRIVALLGRWILARLLYFVVIVAVTLPIIFLRAGVIPQRLKLPAFHWDRYWPAFKQYLTHLLQGSFGPLYQRPPGGGLPPEPVPSNAQIADLIARALPTSLSIFFLALLVGLVGGILFGMLVSRFSARWVRSVATGLNLGFLSFPDILLVVLVQWGIMYLAQIIGFEIVPPFGTWDGKLTGRLLVLPVLLLGLFPGAFIARISAAAFDEAFQADYIRTARSKGLPTRRLVWGHALRNALIPILSSLPTATGLMISNLIVLEWIMALTGVGRLLALEFRAAYPSPNVIASVAIILILLFVLIDGLVDGLLLWLDPKARDRQGQTASDRQPAQGAPRASLGDRLVNLGSFFVEAGYLVAGLLRGLVAPQNWVRPLRAYRSNLPLALGTLIILALVFVAIFAPQLALRGPYEMKPVVMEGKTWIMPPYPPSKEFPLGSDRLGRDTYSRLLFGARYTLLFALFIVPARILLALPLGLAAGWLRGGWERWIRRIATIFGGIPLLVISAVLVPVFFVEPVPATMGNPFAPPPPDPNHVMALHVGIMVLLGWPRLAETIRLMTREIAERSFIEGAQAVGASGGRVMFRHILPNLVPSLLMMGAAEAAWLMMFLTQLGVFGLYLGGTMALESVGQVPRYPDWAHMLARPTQNLHANQWQLFWPALCFFIAILGFHLLAEGIRQAGLPRRVAANVEPSGAKSAADDASTMAG
ncbi:MAG: ABC transporter permease subunit [Bacillota bacterium]